MRFVSALLLCGLLTAPAWSEPTAVTTVLPAWSHDGHSVAYLYSDLDGRWAEVWVSRADGSNSRRLDRLQNDTHEGQNPDFLGWSTDDKTLQVTYIVSDPDRNAPNPDLAKVQKVTMWNVPVDGGSAVQWSPGYVDGAILDVHGDAVCLGTAPVTYYADSVPTYGKLEVTDTAGHLQNR
jgi:hypothetical protein